MGIGREERGRRTAQHTVTPDFSKVIVDGGRGGQKGKELLINGGICAGADLERE
jgi:hypothetical protein